MPASDAVLDSLLRHVRAIDNAGLPGGRVPFRIGAAQVGWVRPGALDGTAAAAGSVPDAAGLDDLSRELAERGAFRPRGEAFDVRARPNGPVIARLDRGAMPVLGAMSEGVHVNGLVRRADGIALWVGRRAMDRPLDAGKLDHLVGGGIPAGLSPLQALAKEAAEEAGLDAATIAGAAPTGIVAYAMNRPEGLRRDRLHCFDLWLPETFQPRPVDGEVVGFELWPLPRVVEAVRRTNDFKFNVNLVLVELFLRTGQVDPAGAEGTRLRAALDRMRDPVDPIA